ncbi:MAG TPA: cytochrome c maturation protein CcmE [Acidimicrobiales bacterium]|nr:cytochrome c maturation protein CcmE [Acidimicrobiales bacterium]
MTDDLAPSPTRPERAKRRRGPIAVIVLLLIAVAAVLFVTLGDATLVFYEVNEVVEQREELVEKRFRVVGTPLPGIVETSVDGESAVIFTFCAAGTYADVAHIGDPAELFQPGVPVVLQGEWVSGSLLEFQTLPNAARDGWYLLTDHMVVKHDNDYRTDQDRETDIESCGLKE